MNFIHTVFRPIQRQANNFLNSFKMSVAFSQSSQSEDIDIGSMRASYKSKHCSFTEDQLVSKNPIIEFKNWFDIAKNCSEILEPNAMCLATCTKSGIPSARYVILKGFGESGFKFYTHYSSRKGEELSENPNAAAVFYWECLRRSIRISGTIEKTSEEDSDTFFRSRPKNSQIGAAFSDQSKPCKDRNYLIEMEKKLQEQYKDVDVIPRPSNWGGYLLVPHTIEFWQGQSDRLHDRICFKRLKEDEISETDLYHRGENGWFYCRLQP